jgi:photosystem II stability/assembly factor-like uncharacterized protein
MGFVTGGIFPTSNTDTFSVPRRISKHLVYNGTSIQIKPDLKKRVGTDDGYQGVIMMATNAASNWQLMVNLTNMGLYFNQISCTDQNNCWAVCEGNNVTTGAVEAWIFATNDGWQTYSTQLTFPQGSLITIQMLSPTFGWAAGATLPEEGQDAEAVGAFYMTTDGMTWTLNGSAKGFYAMDLSVIDMNNAYAAGLSSLGESSLARYS